MQVTMFAENLQDRYTAFYGLVWYVIIKNRKVLFLSGDSRDFCKYARMWKIPVDEIDEVILSQGHGDSMRELEYFLKYNNKARIYLQRKTHETYLRSRYDKLRIYTDSENLGQWKKRIILMNESVNIENDIQIFAGKKKDPFGRLQEQNMILNENGMSTLLVNEERDSIEFVRQKAEAISGKNIDYLFYCGEHQEWMKENCITCEQVKMVMGQTVMIHDEKREKCI